MAKCSGETDVYSSVCGFFRPVQQFNPGKKEKSFNRANDQVEKQTPREGGSK